MITNVLYNLWSPTDRENEWLKDFFEERQTSNFFMTVKNKQNTAKTIYFFIKKKKDAIVGLTVENISSKRGEQIIAFNKSRYIQYWI